MPSHWFIPMKAANFGQKCLKFGFFCGAILNAVITEKIVKQELGHKYYLLKDKEAYIVETIEIEGTHGLPRGTNTISNELQQVIHDVGRRDTNKTLKQILHSGMTAE